MDAIAEKLAAKLQEWQPEVAEEVRKQVAKLIARADHNALELPYHAKPGAPGADWSEAVLTWEGMPDAPRFEALRDDLLPPDESPLG
jgi:hypothetical protein